MGTESRSSHEQVWKTLFDQAKDAISVFVDPHSPRHAHLIQQISFQDMTALQGLRAQSSGALSLKDVEHTFFPKASPSPHTVRSSTSQVTGKTYKHSVKILLTLDPQEYMNIFHRLARRALDRTPPPSPVTWNDLGKLALEVGLLTKDVLRHVAFWFAGHDIDETFLRTPSRSWSDLLGAGPFATRASRNGSSLTHADQSPDEAARLFIQALFDQIRVGFERDWKDEATKEMVRWLLFLYRRMLTGEGVSTPQETLPKREKSVGTPSTHLLSVPVSDSRMARGPRSRPGLRRPPVSPGHGTLQRNAKSQSSPINPQSHPLTAESR